MTSHTTAWVNLVRAVVAACVFAVFAGEASTFIAELLVRNGGPSFLREPINAGIALALIVLWQKWQPVARYSAPKWRHVGIGLVLGLGIGIALPAIALAIMTSTQIAALSPPTVTAVALLVPFIFLIFHGFAEESLVRVIAQRASHHSFGALAGIAAAAICFGGLQALQGYLDVWNIVNGILFGACLGFLALGPGGIWTAIGAHAGWSWLEIAALGQPGQIVKSGHWMGGTGPDSYGSPIFTLVLLAALGLQIVLHLRRQKRSI